MACVKSPNPIFLCVLFKKLFLQLQDLAICNCTPPDVALPATFACQTEAPPDPGSWASSSIPILSSFHLPPVPRRSTEHEAPDCVHLCSPFLLLLNPSSDNWATAAAALRQVPRSSPATSTHHSTRTGAWLQAKIFDPVLQVIRRGAEPKELAFSAALGVTIGIFPICGTTVILGAVAVAMLGSRCNAVTVMVLNLAATPIELSLIVPFLRLGETITGSGHFPLTADALKNVLTGHASKDVVLSIVRAMLGWLVAAPFVLAVLYVVSFPCFKVLVNRFGGIPSSPRTPIKAV